MGCETNPPKSPFSKQPTKTKSKEFTFKEKILSEISADLKLTTAFISPINNKLSVICITDDMKKLLIVDLEGNIIDSVHLEEKYIDVITREGNGFTLIFALSANYSSYKLVYPKDHISYGEIEDMNDIVEWFEMKANFSEFEGYTVYHKLNEVHQSLINGSFDQYRSTHRVDSLLLIVQTGSFYSKNTNISWNERKPFPEEVYVSKKMRFWDQILHFNPESGNLLYYATQECKIYHDNVFDGTSAIQIDIILNQYIDEYSYPYEYDYEKKVIPISSFYDKNKDLLYITDQYEVGKIRIKAIQFENYDLK